MIIVDDGSSDKTYEKALEYSEKDSRIKLFTQKNIGIFRLAETYNFALSKSEGKYIAILEGDDVWVLRNWNYNWLIWKKMNGLYCPLKCLFNCSRFELQLLFNQCF